MSDDRTGMRDDAVDDTPAADRGATPDTPLWVKLFGGIALAVVLLFVVLLLLGLGHGPGRHAASGNHGQTPPSGVTDVRPQP